MRSYTVLLLLGLAIVALVGAASMKEPRLVGGSKNKGDEEASDDDTTIRGDDTIMDGDDTTMGSDDATMGDDDSSDNDEISVPELPLKKPELFTEAWKVAYSAKQLVNQPKWRLAENQPEDGTYQVRVYPTQWWAKSFKQCLGQKKAAGDGYLNLYFYFNGFNYQRQYHSLTYPILDTVDKRPEPTIKPETTIKSKRNEKRHRRRKSPVKVCPVKYYTQFYLPIPLTKYAPETPDKTITSFKAPEETFYVRSYSGNYTSEYCNEQAGVLYLDLLKNNEHIREDYWICAKYEPPEGTTEQKYEVWMKERLQ
uniref:uncharacterized protein LOC120332783 n=1 Tax=Styela clava TaxID=7725 RepID=UPI00193A6178|nr:uncharacterized protein LOC120332783 [Styela clava]